MARRLFNSQVEFKVVSIKKIEREHGGVENHVTFDVTILEDMTSSRGRMDDATMTDVTHCAVASPIALFPTQRSALIGPQVFCNLFPFHVVFDDQLVIRQCGANIQKLHPQR